jgi:hypothetical protein
MKHVPDGIVSFIYKIIIQRQQNDLNLNLR